MEKPADANHVQWEPYWDGGWAQEEWPDTTGDQELFWVGKGKGRGGKGKGGKSKGTVFSGNCFHCGEPGHRLNQCPKNDAEMKGKSKGKSTKGWWKGTRKGGYDQGGASAGAWETLPGLGSLAWLDGESYYGDPNYSSTWPTPDAAYPAAGPPFQLCAVLAEEPKQKVSQPGAQSEFPAVVPPPVTAPTPSEEIDSDEEVLNFVKLVQAMEGCSELNGLEDLPSDCFSDEESGTQWRRSSNAHGPSSRS